MKQEENPALVSLPVKFHEDPNSPRNILERIGSFLVVSITIFFLAGFIEIGLTKIFENFGITLMVIEGVILFAIIEEGLKFFPLWRWNVEPFEYLLVLVTVFTFIEFFYGNWALADLKTIYGWLRLLPHFIFAGFYLLGSLKNKYFGFMLSVAGHSAWNLLFFDFYVY